LDVACMTMTAIENEGRFRWNERSRCTVPHTSKLRVSGRTCYDTAIWRWG
jgi:hypothetical protein